MPKEKDEGWFFLKSELIELKANISAMENIIEIGTKNPTPSDLWWSTSMKVFLEKFKNIEENLDAKRKRL